MVLKTFSIMYWSVLILTVTYCLPVVKDVEDAWLKELNELKDVFHSSEPVRTKVPLPNNKDSQFGGTQWLQNLLELEQLREFKGHQDGDSTLMDSLERFLDNKKEQTIFEEEDLKDTDHQRNWKSKKDRIRIERYAKYGNLSDICLANIYKKKGGRCKHLDGYGPNPIVVISRCPYFTRPSKVKTFCELENLKSVAVVDNVIDLMHTPMQDPNGLVYRNMYCAQCHDVEHPIAWKTRLECNDILPLHVLTGDETLTLMGQVKESASCQRRVFPTVNRMIHECAEEDVVVPTPRGNHQVRTGSGAKSNDVSTMPLSFSILMNFGFDGKTHILFSATQENEYQSITCTKNEIYDPDHNLCRPVSCPDGYDLVDGSCHKHSVSVDEDNMGNNDVSDLTNMDDLAEVTLTMKNLTYGDLMMIYIPGIETIIADQLANIFNISLFRIQNLTMSVSNGSQTDKTIEVHPVDSPPTNTHDVPKTTKSVNLVTARPRVSKVLNGTERMSHDETSFSASFGNESKPFHKIEKYHPSDKAYPTSEIEEDFDTKSDDKIELQESSSTKKLNLVDSKTKPKNGTKELNDIPLNEAMLARVRNENELISTLPQTTVPPPSFLRERLPSFNGTEIYIKIKFILFPSSSTSRNVTREKTVKSVVQKMNDMISTDSLMLTINGTDLKIDSLENDTKVQSVDTWCTLGSRVFYMDGFEILNDIFDENAGRNVTKVYVNTTHSLYGPGQYDLTLHVALTVGNTSRSVMSGFVFVCVMPRVVDKTCVRIELNSTEYKRFHNRSLKFGENIYNMTQYEYLNEGLETVRLCPRYWSQSSVVPQSRWALVCGDDLLKLAVAESYLTFILGVLSLVALLTVLVTYLIFEKLRNLPGVNTINLTAALFLGELLFIISGSKKPQSEWLCSAVGMSLHYLFLASFFWMNVMSFDVYRTFAHKCILPHIRDKKKYLPKYAVYAWGMPAIIVAICAFVDFSKAFDNVRIGYGGTVSKSVSPTPTTESTVTVPTTAPPSVINSSLVSEKDGEHVYSIGCWIQEPVATMIAFGLPMILILIVNSIMFTRTIRCIRATTKIAHLSIKRRSSVNHMTGHDDVMLYIRMSTVMGFTWVFGLASSLISTFASPPSREICIILHVLGILFIIFNCSQGLFIFFAFVANKRVIGLYKGLFTCCCKTNDDNVFKSGLGLTCCRTRKDYSTFRKGLGNQTSSMSRTTLVSVSSQSSMAQGSVSHIT